MSSMFAGATSFNQRQSVDSWNTKKVTNKEGMFD